jgi:hypothetical protein
MGSGTTMSSETKFHRCLDDDEIESVSLKRAAGLNLESYSNARYEGFLVFRVELRSFRCQRC